jgi:hypothetical protein
MNQEKIFGWQKFYHTIILKKVPNNNANIGYTPECPAIYHLIENTQTINYGAILHHNIELNLKKVCMQKI